MRVWDAVGGVTVAVALFVVSASLQGPAGASGSPARSSTELTPVRISITPLDTIRDGRFAPLANPWSPTRPLLALERSTSERTRQVDVYDATAEGPRLRTVHVDPALALVQMRWTSDGRFMVRYLKPPMSDEVAAMVAIAPEGGAREIYRGQPLWPFHLAGDGHLYAQRDGGAWRSPTAVLSDAAPDGTPETTLVVWPTEMVGCRRLITGRDWRIERIPGQDSLAGEGHLLLRDSDPVSHRHLFSGVAGERWITDDQCRVLSRLLRQPTLRGVDWTSLWRGRRWVLGARVRWDGTEAGNILESRLQVADPDAGWIAPIDGAGDGIAPWVSSDGRYIAYEDPVQRTIVVARLSVDAR